MIQIFLSHNTRDRKWCEWLMRSAAAHGIKPYLAEHDVQAGGVLASKIERAIDESAAMIVLITNNSVNSGYVQQEVGYARKAKKLIIPVVQKGITGEQLGMLQGVEYIAFDFASPQEGHAQLTAAMRKLAEKHAKRSGDRDLVLAAAFACLLLLLITLDS
jgi:TIR domain-containing protein